MKEARIKLYVASSWRNPHYPILTQILQEFGYEILDWRDKVKGGGFAWSDVTPIELDRWSGTFFRDDVLTSERAQKGFDFDFGCMQAADACVLLLPAGRSAHLEAGWFTGQGKPLHIHAPVFDGPDLMYKLAKSITFTLPELLTALGRPLRASGQPRA